MKQTLLLTLVVLMTGCVRYDIEEILTGRDDISLTWKGVEQFSHDPASCQTGFNAAKNEFRAQTDNLSAWFVIRCSQMPVSEGDEIEADLSWTGPTNNKTMKGLDFKVKKVSGDGMIWLWCRSAKIGVTIKRLD